MATYQQLSNEVASWINRQDVLPLMAGWTAMVETELNETLRSRAQIVTTTQPIDAPYIALPADFASMESIRDNQTGEILNLKDTWSGSWSDTWQNSGGGPVWSAYSQIQPNPAASAYRIVAGCIEFLPHPNIPNPPDPTWTPQVVQMYYYARMRPLIAATDTNPVLEQLYGCYLFGLLKFAAVWAKDDARAAQADAQYQQAVTRANTWTQQSTYSGAPYVAEMAARF